MLASALVLVLVVAAIVTADIRRRNGEQPGPAGFAVATRLNPCATYPNRHTESLGPERTDDPRLALPLL